MRYPDWPELVMNRTLMELFTVATLGLKSKFYLNHILLSGVFSEIWLMITKPANTAL